MFKQKSLSQPNTIAFLKLTIYNIPFWDYIHFRFFLSFFFFLLTLQELSINKLGLCNHKKKKKSTRQNRTKAKHNMEVILISPWDKWLELHILLQFRLSAVWKINNSKILQDWGLTQRGFKVLELFFTQWHLRNNVNPLINYYFCIYFFSIWENIVFPERASTQLPSSPDSYL